MNKLFQVISIFLSVFLISAEPARAQLCETVFETITTLRPPTFGFPTVWDAKYTDLPENMVQFASGVAQDGGTVFVLGRSISKQDYQPQNLILAEINRRGRALKEYKYPIKTAEQPVKLIQLGSDFIALSNILGGTNNDQKWARISWYSDQGVYKREYIIKDGEFDYEGQGLLEASEGNGFIVILKAINRADETDMNGVLLRVDKSGGVLWRRAYRPGIPNMLNSVVDIGENSYLATGQIRLDDGRFAGWVMKLGFDGAVHWQRTYPRGKDSTFLHSVWSSLWTVEGKGFLLAGQSEPLDDGPASAWIMAIDALGEPQWQRYYRRDDYALSGDWVISEDDGRIILIMKASAMEDNSGAFNHVRMLTLSPRGVMVGDEAYYVGLQATPTDYVPGWNGERILTATITDDDAGKLDEDDEIVVIGLAADDESQIGEAKVAKDPVQKGWVFVATALDPYDDPCLSRRNP